MKILVVYPGFWADGRIYEATRQVLQQKRPGTLMFWRTRPSKDPAVFQIDCYIVEDPECGEFAVPVTRARILRKGVNE